MLRQNGLWEVIHIWAPFDRCEEIRAFEFQNHVNYM